VHFALLFAVAVCGAEDAAAAERALRAFHVPDDPSASAWPQFRKLVERHGQCTDGVLAEFWDDTVTGMFDKQWPGALKFGPLRKDATFREFVAKFGGAKADAYAVRRVMKKAGNCAPADEELCLWIRANFSQ
jgi:hypothetical protein